MHQIAMQTNKAPRIGVSWKRVALWSLALFAATQILSFVVGASTVHWTIYGDPIEAAIENARWFRRALLAVAGYALYILFLRKISHLWFANVLGVFVAVELLNSAFEVLMGASMTQAVSWRFTVGHFLVCIAALATAELLFRDHRILFRRLRRGA